MVFAQTTSSPPLSATALSGGGSDCSKDCQPPVMGVDSLGNRHVDGGLIINGQVFDVEYFKQQIPTGLVEGQNHFTVKVFENSGIDKLQHFEVWMSPYDNFISGVIVEDSISRMEWNKEDSSTDISFMTIDDFTGEFSFSIDLNSFEEDNNIIKITVWDFNRNPWSNYFTFEDGQHIQYVETESLSVEAAYLSSQGKQEEAREVLNQIDDIRAQLDLAKTYFNEYDYQSALFEIDQVLQIDSTYYDALALRAMTLAEMGKIQAAQMEAQKALEIDEKNPDALLSYAIIAYKQNQLDLAEQRVNEVIVLEKDNTHAPLVKAEILSEKGNTLESAINAEKAMSYFPNDQRAIEIKQESMLPGLGMLFLLISAMGIGGFFLMQKGILIQRPYTNN